jgi:hypothetical protein
LIGWPEYGCKQMGATERIEGQVAILVVIPVEEAPFLLTMLGIIGRVEINHDLAWRRFI